ncbi:MAG: aldo/keto reductase [Bacteroidota bacterium]
MENTTKIIVGCMSWGAWGKKLSRTEQSALLEFCAEQGNITFDHADIYGDYTTEVEFGRALNESSIDRESVHLITKCGIQYKGNTRNNRIKHYNLSKDYIIWSAEESLRNLQTDYLDTFLIHRPSPLMNPEEIAQAATSLLESGKIKSFGVSNFTPTQLSMLSKHIDIYSNQIEFSLTQHSAMYDGTLDVMIEKGISAMSWSPLGSYFKKDDERSARIKSVLTELTKKYDASEDLILLAWILKHPANFSPVIGTTNPERIKNANLALKIDLDLEDWFFLLEASQGHKVP